MARNAFVASTTGTGQSSPTAFTDFFSIMSLLSPFRGKFFFHCSRAFAKFQCFFPLLPQIS
jgi:hypothetical protein